MPKKPARLEVNLIPKDPFFETMLGRVLKWALSAGRYIVIFTELVVIASFATRFTLDRQVTDLNTAIFSKQAVIESYGPLEENVRTAQSKIGEYRSISDEENIIDTFSQLTEVTPAGVRYSDLLLQSDRVNIEGFALSQNSFNILINNLQLSPHFLQVSVSKIESSDQGGPGLFFSLQAQTKEVAKVPAKG